MLWCILRDTSSHIKPFHPHNAPAHSNTVEVVSWGSTLFQISTTLQTWLSLIINCSQYWEIEDRNDILPNEDRIADTSALFIRKDEFYYSEGKHTAASSNVFQKQKRDSVQRLPSFIYKNKLELLYFQDHTTMSELTHSSF